MDSLNQHGPVFSFYGDDFTGSTDALEALASAGIPSVLFLQPPGSQQLGEFEGYRGIGIAGDSRSRTPGQMWESLPEAFECLRRIGAPVVQYKVCSTFDSSPEAGSVGCALEIGRQVFGGGRIPVVAAAPALRRYVAFSNLFAADLAISPAAVMRIDRHSSMSRHPVTPMDEADLRLHLARQTSCRIAGFDLVSLRAPDAASRLVAAEADAILFDGVTEHDQARTAQLIWQTHGTAPIFAIGSSGFTYGMLAFWHDQGWIPPAPRLAPARAADRVLVLSGSCSPVTGRQICCALTDGFAGFHLNADDPADAKTVSLALELLRSGRSVILYSALGPDDCRPDTDRERLATAMGQMLADIASRSGVSRVVVAGGDTSSHAVRQTGISALSFLAPLAPGAPLCRAHGGPLHGLELVLKGGQVGRETFFHDVLEGAAT